MPFVFQDRHSNWTSYDSVTYTKWASYYDSLTYGDETLECYISSAEVEAAYQAYLQDNQQSVLRFKFNWHDHELYFHRDPMVQKNVDPDVGVSCSLRSSIRYLCEKSNER